MIIANEYGKTKSIDCTEPQVITEKVVEFEENLLINNVVLFKINQTKVDTYQGYLFYLLNFWDKDTYVICKN